MHNNVVCELLASAAYLRKARMFAAFEASEALITRFKDSSHANKALLIGLRYVGICSGHVMSVAVV